MSHTYVQLGQPIDVVQQRRRRAVDERLHDALGGHARQNLLLRAQSDVTCLERIVRHDCAIEWDRRRAHVIKENSRKGRETRLLVINCI